MTGAATPARTSRAAAARAGRRNPSGARLAWAFVVLLLLLVACLGALSLLGRLSPDRPGADRL